MSGVVSGPLGAERPPIELDVEGPAAPPRSNGELVFAEPWESRAFGLAFALCEQGAFSWEEFREELIATITEWERRAEPGEGWSYYRCWLEALERLSVRHGLVDGAEIDSRAGALAERPSGHDHDHA